MQSQIVKFGILLAVPMLLFVSCSNGQPEPAWTSTPNPTVSMSIATPTPFSVPAPASTPTYVPSPKLTPAPATAPGFSFLPEEIPPCTPVEGVSVDPCELGASAPEVGIAQGVPYLGDEPLSMRELLDGIQPPTWVTHLVVRGTYLPNTVRCAAGNVLRPPSYLEQEFNNLADSLSIKCYIDVRSNAYYLGSGPPTLTVLVYRYLYWDNWFTPYLEEGQTEQDLIEEQRQRFEGLVRDFFPGREHVIFLGPPVDLSTEAWRLMGFWDVQRREDSTVIAVHPGRDLWRDLRPDDYPTHISALEMEFPALTQALTTAHQARVTEYGGRIGADESLPMLVTDGNQLGQYYIEVGAYDRGSPTPVQPPPPCGLVVPDQANNPGLMLDCMALLGAKDMLRGTATLDWSVDTAIANWDGIATGGTPSRVTRLLRPGESLSGTIPAELGDLFELTHLDLSSNSLTGDVPKGLGWLSHLQEIRLSGNTLTGCIPAALRDAPANDLSLLNLLYCPPAPEGLSAGPAGEASVPLSWTAVSSASKYRVEYRDLNLDDWIVGDDILAGTSYTVDELWCENEYLFRVSVFGDGTTYAADWSDPSDFLLAITGACVPPTFGATSYAFAVLGDAEVGTAVGVVTAAGSGANDPVTYSIAGGDENGGFTIDTSSGAITVAGDLSSVAGSSIVLTVEARDESGGSATVAVGVTVSG